VSAGDQPAEESRTRLQWRRLGTAEEGFRYENPTGMPITGRNHLARIARLAIPPAWQDVEVSADPTADLQATGIDARGRRQYLYHPRTIEERERAKYGRQPRFGAHLPDVRRRTDADMRGDEPTRALVLATVVRLIDEAYFRVGSDRYAEENKTYGITTLTKRHMKLEGDEMRFSYRAKSGLWQRAVVADADLLELVELIAQLPGRRLFQYVDEEGTVRPVGAREVNRYIQAAMGRRHTAKDFRTWGGTLAAAEALTEVGPPQSDRQAKRAIVDAGKHVAELLGNTPAVARSAYINPVVFDWYREGVTLDRYERRAERRVRRERLPYDPSELALLSLLRRPRTELQAA
jgi:DNA topoisomerase-1